MHTSPPSTAREALDRLQLAAASDTSPHPDQFVVGTVGHDVPTEVLRAAGAVPLRLRGNPTWASDAADHYLGRGLDPATRSLLAGILAGAFGRLDAILVSSDCDASQRLYYVLREIRRVNDRTDIPPVHLIDILHLPRESTARYNLVRMRELVEVIERWTGDTITADALTAAVEASNRRRALQRDVMSWRHGGIVRLRGSDALAVFAAADRMPGAEYDACLEMLAAAGDQLDAVPGIRLALTGSNHDRPAVYEAIEDAGAIVVAEDHDHGQLLCERDVVMPATVVDTAPEVPALDARDCILDAIGRRYQCNGPTAQRASIGDRAEHTARMVEVAGAELVLSYVRVMDEAPLWDFAAQRRAVSVPSAVVVRQTYGQIDTDALTRALNEPHTTGVNA